MVHILLVSLCKASISLNFFMLKCMSVVDKVADTCLDHLDPPVKFCIPRALSMCVEGLNCLNPQNPTITVSSSRILSTGLYTVEASLDKSVHVCNVLTDLINQYPGVSNQIHYHTIFLTPKHSLAPPSIQCTCKCV